MRRVLYKCMECWNAGKERTFHTLSGYRSHLLNYHMADYKDLVKFKPALYEPDKR